MKRGRPKNNGQKPIWTLTRITLALYGYQQARAAGEKHACAVQEAVEYVRKKAPMMPISETEVRRILAQYRSNKLPYGCFVVKPDPANQTIILPRGYVFKVGLTVCVQPRVDYPRANAVETPIEGRKVVATTLDS